MKTLYSIVALAGLMTLGSAAAAAQTAPKTVIHVVTVTWKPGTTPAQIQAALDGVQALPRHYFGILRVWTRTLDVPDGRANAIAMEFADEAALKAYAHSEAQREWYGVYLPIRADSDAYDITN